MSISPSQFKTGRHLKIIGKWGPLQAPSRFKAGQIIGTFYEDCIKIWFEFDLKMGWVLYSGQD